MNVMQSLTNLLVSQRSGVGLERAPVLDVRPFLM
jgi:hypothetical protein